MRTRDQIEADIKSVQQALAAAGRAAEEEEDSRISSGMFFGTSPSWDIYDNCYRRIAELRRELDSLGPAPKPKETP